MDISYKELEVNQGITKLDWGKEAAIENIKHGGRKGKITRTR
ncbi:hypothetical protein ACT7C7_29545 [Bacillus cereus]